MYESSQYKLKQIKWLSNFPLFLPPCMSNTHQWIPMETWFSDGIGKILFVTPSHGSKITGSHDGKEYRKSDKYWGRNKCCPMESIDIHSSDGIQWSPSMSIGITRSVVVNLNSDNELTFCPLLIFSLSPTELEKYYSTRKYYRARKIQLATRAIL